jgi:hypothetical protein
MTVSRRCSAVFPLFNNLGNAGKHPFSLFNISERIICADFACVSCFFYQIIHVKFNLISAAKVIKKSIAHFNSGGSGHNDRKKEVCFLYMRGFPAIFDCPFP